ncbi:hypothetical protein MpV1_060 [Micromonas sp. RCC1109 virus MpV1]|uniref:hypothetical protein n=1 Tax=Micromonas sp. RCC1109 virus MpV1 TaxID=880161 RepID=UPI0001EF4458|nr:hypothetical protein MpV1_060 [Micromonas sp. RCC1109 virus MpV1]ADQ90983.1 hypothetical protein MpV1_060 [Micromonas sp. RCC1109 virus MpV1]
MWWVFLLLYCSYLILGPHWESKLIKGEQLAIVDSKEELGRRSIFISYVALLFISWFLLRPSQSSFMSALILTIAATTGFHMKYGPEKPIPMHLILTVFLLYQGRMYMSIQLWLTMILIGLYTTMHENLYIP